MKYLDGNRRFRAQYASLAAAVIAQWRYDGKPMSDKTSIDLWRGVVEASRTVLNEHEVHLQRRQK